MYRLSQARLEWLGFRPWSSTTRRGVHFDQMDAMARASKQEAVLDED